MNYHCTLGRHFLGSEAKQVVAQVKATTMGKRKVSHTSDGEIDTVKDEVEDGVKDGVDMEGDVSMKSISEGGDEESAAEVKVIGEILKKSGGNGKADKKLYEAFEVDGNRYEIVRNLPHAITYKPLIISLSQVKSPSLNLWKFCGNAAHSSFEEYIANFIST